MVEQDFFGEETLKGADLGYEQLLKFQMFWINKAIALDVKRQIINLIFGLESMLITYLDETYKQEKEELIKEYKNKDKIGLFEQTFIAKNKYRLLIALMDRKGLLLEKSQTDVV